MKIVALTKVKKFLGRRALHAAMATAVLTGLAASVPCNGCYTGLALIPTADVVEPGTYSIEAQFDASFTGGDENTRFLDTEFGVTPRFEVGIDNDFSKTAETRILLNAKYVMITRHRHNPAVAVGICNVGRRLRSSPYVVATKDFAATRGHVGVISMDGVGCWFAGVDKAIGERRVLMADYISGTGNDWSIGVSRQFNDRFGITSGVVFPNAGGGAGFTMHLVFGGSYRQGRGKE